MPAILRQFVPQEEFNDREFQEGFSLLQRQQTDILPLGPTWFVFGITALLLQFEGSYAQKDLRRQNDDDQRHADDQFRVSR